MENMKMNISIDLSEFNFCNGDFDGEEGCNGEGGSFQDFLIHKIMEKITDGVKIESIVNARLTKIIDGHVKDGLIHEISLLSERMMSDYLNREIAITDRWGNEKERGTLRELIHKKFDSMLKEMVNENGNPASSYDDDKRTRVEHIVKHVLDSRIKEFTKNAVKEVETAVENKLTDELKNAVGKNMVENLGVPRIMESINKGLNKGL